MRARLRRRGMLLKLCIVGLLVAAGCGRLGYESHEPDASVATVDAGAIDAGGNDAGDVDAGPVDAGSVGVDAGETCPAGQWRDYVASTCNPCPATTLTCAAGVDTVSATTFFDPPSGIFHIQLLGGLAQIVGGTLTIRIDRSGATVDLPISLMPVHNIVIAPSGTALTDPTITGVTIVSLSLVDACGTTMPIPDFRALMVVGMPGSISASDFYCGS